MQIGETANHIVKIDDYIVRLLFQRTKSFFLRKAFFSITRCITCSLLQFPL